MPKCKTDKKYILEIWTVTKNLKTAIAYTHVLLLQCLVCTGCPSTSSWFYLNINKPFAHGLSLHFLSCIAYMLEHSDSN